MNFPQRLVAGLAVTFLAACTVPGTNTFVGGGPLPFNALAVTSIDAETGNPSYKALLSWNAPLNAKTYEVQRKFGDNASKVVATISDTKYTDATVGADQSFTYTIRALSGENKELVTSNPQTIKVLGAAVTKPTGLMPADNASIGVGEMPTFSWQPVANANWYYVRVVNGTDDSTVWSALTKDTSLKFGAESPLSLSAFADQFPVGSKASITRGVVYRWTVSAVRGDAADLTAVHAIDVNPSAAQRFSQGS